MAHLAQHGILRLLGADSDAVAVTKSSGRLIQTRAGSRLVTTRELEGGEGLEGQIQGQGSSSVGCVRHADVKVLERGAHGQSA